MSTVSSSVSVASIELIDSGDEILVKKSEPESRQIFKDPVDVVDFVDLNHDRQNYREQPPKLHIYVLPLFTSFFRKQKKYVKLRRLMQR